MKAVPLILVSLLLFCTVGSGAYADDASQDCYTIWNDKIRAKCKFEKNVPHEHPYMEQYRVWKKAQLNDAVPHKILLFNTEADTSTYPSIVSVIESYEYLEDYELSRDPAYNSEQVVQLLITINQIDPTCYQSKALVDRFSDLTASTVMKLLSSSNKS